MTESNEIFDEEDKMILEVFPYPKWVQLFNYFFPRTEGYKSINWRKHLKTWSRWAPWLTIFLLIGILFFGAATGLIGFATFSLILFVPCFLRFVYLLVLALIAKCLRRSPITALSLMPFPALCALIILMFSFLIYSIFADDSGASEKQKKVAVVMQKPSKAETVDVETKEEPFLEKKSQSLKEENNHRKYEYAVL
ncbi:MAG: hypothetical protein K2X08_04090 [Chlamydiales bacterium]|nr:hypothetical protein [Chlamydiales bacterium]MBY0529910.1 hypothetical protein [Rhabdochlamydiaceae bacterium]